MNVKGGEAILPQPLAYRMRPKTISDVFGQEHLLATGKPIARMVKANRIQSMVLFGPPGTGKTSIASAIAGSCGLPFKIFNAAIDTKKELQQIAAEAQLYPEGMVLLLDEIHRLDKAKQDFLLPHLENGRLILIGATTENPYISLNSAVRSRVQIFELYPLEAIHIEQALKRALQTDAILQKQEVVLEDNALQTLSERVNGDVRKALNTLEVVALSTDDVAGKRLIKAKDLLTALGESTLTFDKDGDAHYDLISAFQKAIRGSDVDASLHYLARLLLGGDLVSLCRRLLVIAYEDIGLANPNAAARTLSAIQAAERLGLPEARIPLADAVIDLCLSPKSNSGIKSIDAAMKDIKQGKSGAIPDHLRDAHYSGAEKRNHGVDYQYPHNFSDAWVNQQYLPDAIKDKQYYQGKTTGRYERALVARYEQLKARKEE